MVNIIWGVGFKGVSKHPSVADAEDRHFVGGFVAEFFGIVCCESFFVWEFFYFSLRIVKRFQNCGNLGCIIRGAPFFGIQTSAEHLIFCSI